MPTPYEKLKANLDYLRKRGASPARQKQEIEKFRQSQERISAEERKLSGVEKVAAVGSKLGSGATFGLLDEAAGLFGDDEKDVQRFLQNQLREENPGVALAAEVAGGLAVPGSIFKAAPKAAGFARKAGTVLAEGAAQGGLSGLGNAEGGLDERVSAALKGGAAGGATAGALSGVTRGLSRVAGRAGEAMGLTAPSLDDLVNKIPDEDITSARQKLTDLRGRNLAHETTVADVLPQGEGALRQAATSNRAVRKNVDTELRSRSNRLANEADDRFSQHTGTQRQSARKSVEELNEESATRAKPFYKAAEEEAASAGPSQRLTAAERKQMAEMGVPADKIPSDAIDEALALPYVQQRITQLRAEPRSGWVKKADDDHALLDQVYKDIGRKIRSLDRKDWELKGDLMKQRAVLVEAITSRAPSYKKALSEFADPQARREAYELGSRKAPADMVPSELSGLDAGESAMYREGKAQALRRDVPNLDVGEFARFQDVLAPIATREKAAVFKATFGEKAYTEYVKDLLAMAGLQRMKAGAGESTTVDKLMEQLQGDPSAISGMIAELLRGNPMAAIAKAAPVGRVGQLLDRLRNSKVAQTNADFLLRRGDANVTKSLDELVAMRQAGQRSTGRSYRGQRGRRALGVTARIVGGNAGSE